MNHTWFSFVMSSDSLSSPLSNNFICSRSSSISCCKAFKKGKVELLQGKLKELFRECEFPKSKVEIQWQHRITERILNKIDVCLNEVINHNCADLSRLDIFIYDKGSGYSGMRGCDTPRKKSCFKNKVFFAM